MQRVDSNIFTSASRLPLLETLLTEKQIARLEELSRQPKLPPPDLDAAALLEWRLCFSDCGAGIFLPVFVRQVMAMWEEEGALGRGPLRRAGLKLVNPHAHSIEREKEKEEQHQQKRNSRQRQQEQHRRSSSVRSRGTLVGGSDAEAAATTTADSASSSSSDDEDYYAHQKVYSHQDLLVLLIRWAIAVGVRSRVSSSSSVTAAEDKIWDDTNSAVVPPNEVRLTTAALLAPSQRAVEERKRRAAEAGKEEGSSSSSSDDASDLVSSPSGVSFQFTFSQSTVFCHHDGNDDGDDDDNHQSSESAAAVHQNKKKKKRRREAFWEVELRDYFLRWGEITSALLAGSAKAAFSFDNDAANDESTASKSFCPYASTRVVRSLRKRAMAAARIALGGGGDGGPNELGDDNDSDNGSDDGAGGSSDPLHRLSADDFYEDEGGHKVRKKRQKKKKSSRTHIDVEELHHAPVTSAVVAPRLGSIVTGALDGTVKLWSRATGDFQKNIYCCSGRTTICGLACVPCGSNSDVVVIGTSTSHLALYSTLTNTVVKEYLGTSERKAGTVKWSSVSAAAPASSPSASPAAPEQEAPKKKDGCMVKSSSGSSSGGISRTPRPPSSSATYSSSSATPHFAKSTRNFSMRNSTARRTPTKEEEEQKEEDEEEEQHQQQQLAEKEKKEQDESHDHDHEDHHHHAAPAPPTASPSSPSSSGKFRIGKIAPIPLRPTFTTSRYRALPGTYGKRIIKPPPISTAVDSSSFFQEWRERQDREVLRTVPAAQIHNLSRLSLLATIQPNLGEPSVVAFGTADGTVGLLDMNEEFLDAVSYGGIDMGRKLQSVAVVETHSSTVTSIAYCHRHRAILSCAYDGQCIPRNIETSALMPALGHPTKAINSMSWCEAQQMLATVTSDRKAYAWSFLGRRPVHEVTLDSRPVSVVLSSAKSQMAVLCEDRQMLIFDTRTFRCLQGLSVVTDRAEREATIVVGGDDDEVQDLDLTAKSTLATLDSSSTHISPYDATELHRGAGTLLCDGADIIAVHREVSVLKDSLGKVSVRVRNDGKVPIYGFRFDVFDDTLENAPPPAVESNDKMAAAGTVAEDGREEKQQQQQEQQTRPRRTSIVGFKNLDDEQDGAEFDEMLGSFIGSSPPDSPRNDKISSGNELSSVSLAGHSGLNRHAARRRSSSGGLKGSLGPQEFQVSVSGNFVGFEQDDPHEMSLIRRDGDNNIISTSRKRAASLAATSSPGRNKPSTQEELIAPSPEQQAKQKRAALQRQNTMTGSSRNSNSPLERRRASAALFTASAVSTAAEQHQQRRTLSSSSPSPNRHLSPQQQLRHIRPVLKAPPVGILYNKRNGMIVVADADGFVGSDVRSGEVIFCVASEKSLGQTTANLATGGRLVAQTQRVGWCPCDSGKMRGVQHDSFLSLSRVGVIAEWNVVDGTALRLTEPAAWAAELKPGGKRPRRDRAFHDICACEKLCAIAQGETVFVLNEIARRAPKMPAAGTDTASIFAEILSDSTSTAARESGGESSAAASLSPPPAAAAVSRVAIPPAASSSASAATKLHHYSPSNTAASDKTRSGPNTSGNPNASFAGHNAFSVDCGDTITAMSFSHGCEYLAVGTLRGLLHTVHVESTETIALTLSLLRAGEPTSPIVSVVWNSHVGDCTVFAAVALGRVVAIHSPTRTVMLSLAVDLGPRHLGVFLSSLHVQRHQSRGGVALEALAIGDTGGVVRVVTLQVRKRGEILKEEEMRKEAESGRKNDSSAASGVVSPSAAATAADEKKTGASSSVADSGGANNTSFRHRGSSSNNSMRRKTSSSFQEVKRTPTNGVEWSSPLTVAAMPDADVKLQHLRSLRDLYAGTKEDFAAERRNSVQSVHFDNFSSDDETTCSDSDDDKQVPLIKTFSGAYARRDSASGGGRDVSVLAGSGGKSTLADSAGASARAASSPQQPQAHHGVNSQHQTVRAQNHEKRKARRRLAIINDPENSTRLAANKAVRMQGGNFSKRRKGHIFRDVFDFMEPTNRGPDPQMETPVWCGCIDGTVSLRDLGCSGAVCQLQFLALRRLGARHGMALIAAATADGNVSILRWARVHDDEPSSLVCMTRLRCPITAQSRGPFWNEGLLALLPPRRETILEAMAGAGPPSSSSPSSASLPPFFLTEQQPQPQQQQKKKREGGASFATFVGIDGKSEEQQQHEKSTVGDDDDDVFTPRRGAAAGQASFSTSAAAKAEAEQQQRKLQQSPYHARPLSAEEEEAIRRHDKMIQNFLPTDKVWSPLGTGFVHDESNMVYCLDDRWDECEEAALKPRDIAPPSKAQVKRQKSIRRQSTVAFTGMTSPDKKKKEGTVSGDGRLKKEGGEGNNNDDDDATKKPLSFTAFEDDIFGESVDAVASGEEQKQHAAAVPALSVTKTKAADPAAEIPSPSPPSPATGNDVSSSPSSSLVKASSSGRLGGTPRATAGAMLRAVGSNAHFISQGRQQQASRSSFYSMPRTISTDNVKNLSNESTPTTTTTAARCSGADLETMLRQQEEEEDEQRRQEEERAEREARERWQGLRLDARPDGEKLKGAFERLKNVRGDVRMRRVHPMLDKVHLKLEAADDVKRESLHKTEREAMPGWLDAMRSGQEPITISNVLMMSRPPPVLLKKSKRVEAKWQDLK